MGRLDGKVALITGAGSGMGKAAAILFAKENAKLALVDWEEKGGIDTLGEIEKYSTGAIFLKADVSKEDDVKKSLSEVKKQFGELHVIYNNAGIGPSFGHMGSIEETGVEDWDLVMRINLRSIFLCCKYGIPLLLESGGGSIINTGSINALAPILGFDAYTASKGGIVSLTRVLARQYGLRNIRVNCICPGPIETPMLAARAAQPQHQDRFRQSTALGRTAKPIEVAYLALFLASDESSYITGATIPIDGGWSAGWTPRQP
ncbi:MAG: SDR family oxidoreductase [Candidatus Helarchaeota archaeon]|nr:SDR family oxidoreductase [Candidatus Helarchaeota archaeon]